MCGFAGFVELSGFNSESAHVTAEKMGQAILHRGPDDSGVWLDVSAGLVLSHRRLSILDLSPAGHQPMFSVSGRYVIAFNGEIYNHLALRERIEAKSGITCWRGHSDTETLLAAIESWGVEETLKQSIGMFAFALWDRQTRMLTLARDRMGEKPLYYGWQGQGQAAAFLFASELKALKAHPSFVGEIYRGALCLQLRHNYIPAPYSIYQGIHKLPPGHLLQLSLERGLAAPGILPQSRPYWSLDEVVKSGLSTPFAGSDGEAIAALDGLLRDAISRQMVADVPLGAFLSGGIDSSTVVALMQTQSTRPVRTFTIGFHEAGYNEAVHAKAVAQHLGTDHNELYVTPEQAMAVIPQLPALYDEPFSDSSQIPTYLISQLARKHVTVSLSGDAGDELFGGYNRYFGTPKWWRRISAIPLEIRRFISNQLSRPNPGTWDQIGQRIARFSANTERWLNFGNRMQKLTAVLRVENSSSLYRHFVSHWPKPADLVIGGGEPPTQITHTLFSLDNIVDQVMALDTVSYLPDDILVKVDRAAMGVSLETRVPFLDHRVVEFAWHLPSHMKIRDGQGKWILRQVLHKYVPKELIERPKMGFGVPIDSWLRGPLRDWAESLLDESRLRREGFFNPSPIRQKWAEHLSGQHNWQYHLWDVLMFQTWLEANRG